MTERESKELAMDRAYRVAEDAERSGDELTDEEMREVYLEELDRIREREHRYGFEE
jgi:hypothetical protein